MRRFALICVMAAVFAGCGTKQSFVQQAETEGVSVDVGGLVYQVQLSRFLNPGNIEDKEYLMGLPEGTPTQLPGDETWFGVWMRVKNFTDETLTPTTAFTITDTENNSYRPVPQSDTNPFIYNPKPLGPDQVLPTPDSAAASGPIQGALILFRLKTDSLQNRPLKLTIEQGGAEPAEVDLDL